MSSPSPNFTAKITTTRPTVKFLMAVHIVKVDGVLVFFESLSIHDKKKIDLVCMLMDNTVISKIMFSIKNILSTIRGTILRRSTTLPNI